MNSNTFVKGVFVGIFLCSGLTCFSQKDKMGLRYTVSNGTAGTTLRSIGTELDPHFHAQHIYQSAGAKAEDWDNVIVPRIKKMQIQSFRCMVLPNWYEAENDNDDPSAMNWDAFTFNSEEMQGLYKVLDLAEELGIKVTIVPWGAYRDTFLAPGTSGWVVAPTKLDEYAENLAALMKQLVEVKGYTCVDELTPGNEPDGWGMVASTYVTLCKTLYDRLQVEGLIGKFKLALIDNTDRGGSFDYISACTSELKGIADVAVSHTYIFGYNTASKDITTWEQNNVKYAKSMGGTHFVGEFGGNMCVGSSRQTDIDWYRRGVLMVRNAIAMLSGGASGVSYWQLFDEYYSKYDGYAQMQQLGMWKSVKEDYASEDYYSSITCDYQPRPQYYAYSLLTRFIRPGAKIYAMGGNTIANGLSNNCCMAAKNEDGTWVYVVANLQEDYNIGVTLKNSKEAISGQYERYVYKEDLLPTDDSMIQPDAEYVDGSAGSIVQTIPANSVVLYRSVTGPNSIQSLNTSETTNDKKYNLQGMNIEKPRKGLYIQAGRKFLISTPEP